MSTDHRIVTAKIGLSQRKNDTQTTTTKQYVWDPLNNKNIREKYTSAIRKKYDALQEQTETFTPNEEYENFVNAHFEALAEFIPTKQRWKYRVPWKTFAVKEKRADVKAASKCNRKNPTNTNALKTETNAHKTN